GEPHQRDQLARLHAEAHAAQDLALAAFEAQAVDAENAHRSSVIPSVARERCGRAARKGGFGAPPAHTDPSLTLRMTLIPSPPSTASPASRPAATAAATAPDTAPRRGCPG